ncbi:MAG: YibE/F family protein [Tissierellales bacterium]|nr:YibE/F family protein [Tissierellales bacterium]HCX03948.1 YibE/F family protein [Clostridiales bacterium]
MIKKIRTPLFFIVLTILVFVFFVINNTMENVDRDLEVKAEVLEVDDSNIVSNGIASIGNQTLLIEVLDGDYKGEKFYADNLLLGQLEMDNYYQVGDKIIAALLIDKNTGAIRGAKAIDMFRQNSIIIMFSIFTILLVLFAKTVGIKALFSFVASLYIIWNFLVKRILEGNDPIFTAVLTLVILSAIIIFSVAGFTKKGISAFLGTIIGLLITTVLTLVFGKEMGLMGMTQAYSMSVLINGNLNLNMLEVFYAAIIIGASGAAMDIAMDVSASMKEIVEKKPEISEKELIKSGFNVGSAVIGTMTTTLLLAYSGGYLTLLMLFMTKNSSFLRIINLKIVSAEIMRTLIGSIGLVIVAPITALIAGNIYKFSKEQKKGEKREKIEESINY